jgi:hypothetical protein
VVITVRTTGIAVAVSAAAAVSGCCSSVRCCGTVVGSEVLPRDKSVALMVMQLLRNKRYISRCNSCNKEI